MTTVLAIDQGTSVTKAVVIGASGKVLAYASERVTTTSLPGGGMQQDPDEIYRSVLAAGTKATAQSGRRIDAVAMATQGESVLAFDPTSGAPLSPVITWQDRRAEEICRRLAARAQEFAATTGLRLSSYFTAPKMAWLRETVTRDGVVSTVDAWLLNRMTGQFATDAATASRSLLVDLDSGTWNPALAKTFGLEAEPMPRIVANDEIVGETSEFGFPVPVAGVILDQPAALLAQRCLRAGQVKVTYGTGAFLLANAGTKPPAQPSALTCSTAWQIGGKRTFCHDGQVFAAASALSWLVKIGVLDRVDNLDAVSARTPGYTAFVPSFDTPSGGSLSGLELGTRRDQIVAAAVYGIAAAVAELYDASVMGVDVLLVDGGLTGSKALLQAQANLLQVPVRAYTGAYATAQGAAALARLALDRGTSIDREIPADRAAKPVRPVWSPDQAADYRDLWRRAADSVARGHERSPVTVAA